jgi:hypothetical protein
VVVPGIGTTVPVDGSRTLFRTAARPCTISSNIGLGGVDLKSLRLLYLISMLDPDRGNVLTGTCSSISAVDVPKTCTEYF